MSLRTAWHVAILLAAAAGLAALPEARAASPSRRVVYDFSANNGALWHQDYSGVALSPDGASLWIVNEEDWASITLTGKVRLHGTMPNQAGVLFGSLSFDSGGNAWGVFDGSSTAVPADGTIFKITPAGNLSLVQYLTDGNGHPQSGLSYYQGAVYGQAWVYGSGPANLFRMSTSTGQLGNVAATNGTGVDRGRPFLTSSGILYAANANYHVSNGNYLGADTLLRYDTLTKASASLGFVAGAVTPYEILIYGGAGTPAVDQFGNAYVAVDRSQTVVPYSDVLLAVSPAGAVTKLHYFPNLNNDFNTFSGLVFDPVHKRLYGGYYEINGADYAKSNPGTLFCYNPATNNFATIFRFNGYDGALPVGDFAIDATGTHLYGATSGGGKAFDGSVFNSGYGEIFELSLGTTPPC